MISIKDRTPLESTKFENFVNLTAHELKTPVSVLKAYLQMIMRQLQKADQQNCMKTVERMEIQLDKLMHLICDMQDGIRADSEKMHCLMNELDVNDFLSMCAQDTIATHPGFEVTLELDHTRPVSMADKERIDQVVHNLINNSVKYSGDEKYIKLSSKVQEKTVVISVTDQGIGIPAAQQAHVFDLFYRVNNSLGKQPDGLGIGLYICAEIIRKHSGKIWLSSEYGNGSTFSFSLPLKSSLNYPGQITDS